LKIVYFLDLPSGPHSGVGEKVLAQTDVWVRLGHDVLIVVITPIQHFDAWESVTDKGLIKVISYRSTIKRIVGRIRSSLFIWHLSKSENILLYLRLSLMTPDQIALLTSVPYFIEVNADVLFEYKMRKLRLVHFIYRLIEGKVMQGAKGTFFVTSELRKIYCNRYLLENAEVITNGISLDSNQSISLNFSYDLVFLATDILPWHGFDKIIKIVEHNPSLNFMVITKSPLSENLFQETSKLKNITTFSALSAQEIERLVKGSVAGISSLSIDVSGLTETADLKTRYYLSRGLPVVSAFKDSAFETNSKLFLMISDLNLDSRNVNLQQFITYWKSRRVKISQLEVIDIGKLEAKRLATIEGAMTLLS